MNTIYQCPDGVIRWTGETPDKGAGVFSILNRIILIGIPVLCIITLIAEGFDDFFGTVSTFVLSIAFWRFVLFVIQKLFFKGGQRMFYELDNTGLTIHEMNGKTADLNNLLYRYAKGDTVRFPSARKSTRLPRAACSAAVSGTDEHTVVVNGDTKLYTLGSAAELVAVLNGAPAPSTAPLRSASLTSGKPAGNRTINASASLAQHSMKVAGELVSQTVKVKAPKKAGTLRIQLPENNAQMLGKAIKAMGGMR